MSFDLADVLKGVPNLGTGREQIEYIRLDMLDADPNNFYSLGGIDGLAANIALCGLQQPILVRQKADGRYVVVSGHRRRAALELLATDEPERWAEVQCIVERDSASPALQELRLIYANANTRVMTSAELSEQAERVENLLYQLKEEGYDFPGRMRDHVAQAVGASKSKLARLKVIREGLIPQFAEMWKSGKLNDAAAYALAGQSAVRQNYILAANPNPDYFYLSADTIVWRFGLMDEIDRKCKKLSCRSGKKCSHADARMQRAGGGGFLHCSGCCTSCSYLPDCTFNCPDSVGKQLKLKAEQKMKRQHEKAAEEKRCQPEKDLLATAYCRIGQLRKEQNVSAKDCLSVYCGYVRDSDIDRLEKLEAGAPPKRTERMPGGIWAYDAQRLIALADLLGCSIDYLLGRDVPNLGTNPAGER